MIKRNHVGLLVWGSIFVAAAIVANEVPVLFWMLLIGGVIMLAFGIVLLIKTTKYNNEIINKYKDVVFRASCPHCKREIETTVYTFRQHKRYPEGFVYCPICKKPVSSLAFTPNQKD